MKKGVIYIATTAIPGLIKIGKTDNFENRMYNLERNGYYNANGIHRYFAIELDNYSEKEVMLQDIFAKQRLDQSELFALDKELVKQLLLSFDGTVIYPKNINKEKEFEEVSDEIRDSKWTVNDFLNAIQGKDFYDDVKNICDFSRKLEGEYNVKIKIGSNGREPTSFGLKICDWDDKIAFFTIRNNGDLWLKKWFNADKNETQKKIAKDIFSRSIPEKSGNLFIKWNDWKAKIEQFEDTILSVAKGEYR